MKLAVILSFIFASQTATAFAANLAPGTYIGRGINVTVTKEVVKVTLGCADGSFPNPQLNSAGKFETMGRIESAKITRDSQSFPAKYIGETEKNGLLRLWIEEAGKSRAEFRLEKGNSQNLLRCQ